MKLTHETRVQKNPSQILLPRFTVSQIMRNDQQVSFRIFFTANHHTFDKDDYIVVKYAEVDYSGCPVVDSETGYIKFFKPQNKPLIPEEEKTDRIIFGSLKKKKNGAYTIDWGKYQDSTVKSSPQTNKDSDKRASAFYAKTTAERLAKAITPTEMSLAKATLSNVAIEELDEKQAELVLSHLTTPSISEECQFSQRQKDSVIEGIEQATATMSTVVPGTRSMQVIRDRYESYEAEMLMGNIIENVVTPPATRPNDDRISFATSQTTSLIGTPQFSNDKGENLQQKEDKIIFKGLTLKQQQYVLEALRGSYSLTPSEDSYISSISGNIVNGDNISDSDNISGSDNQNGNSGEMNEEEKQALIKEAKRNYWNQGVKEKDFVRILTDKEKAAEKTNAKKARLEVYLSDKVDKHYDNDDSNIEDESNTQEDGKEPTQDTSKEEIDSNGQISGNQESNDTSSSTTPPGSGEIYDPGSDNQTSTDSNIPTVPSPEYKPGTEPNSDSIQPSLPSTDPDATDDPPTEDDRVDVIVPDGIVSEDSSSKTKKKSRFQTVFSVREGEEEDEEYLDYDNLDDVGGGEEFTPLQDEPPRHEEPPPPPPPEPPKNPPTLPGYAFGHIRPFQCHYAPGYDTVTGDLVWKVGFGFKGSFDTFDEYVSFLGRHILSRVQEEVDARPNSNDPDYYRNKVKIYKDEIIDMTAVIAQKRLYFRSSPGYVYCYWGHSTPRMLRLFQAPYYFRNHHGSHLYWYLVCASANSTEIKDNTYRILIGRHGFVNRGEELVISSYTPITIPGNSFFNPMWIEIRDENDELYPLQVPYIVEWTFTPIKAS